jgi:hypothetical protein
LSSASSLRFHDFKAADPLLGLHNAQSVYLHDYLIDLKARSVVEEPTYFDHDYLAEFEAFYARSSRSYPNTCRRLHFFDGEPVTRDILEQALGGDETKVAALRASYLGFVVVRPIPAAPLGRTIVRLYPDPKKETPRVVTSRSYAAHLCGLRLEVEGLAWQQQDSAVGACATVALWSLMHSSAFDEHHAIPTTAEVTRLAGRGGLGQRVFPSGGLTLIQIIEAIKGAGLAPIVVTGKRSSDSSSACFSAAEFCGSLAAMIRAGFPVLVSGALVEDEKERGKHAVCAVGFRDAGHAGPLEGGSVLFQDSLVPHLYVHDDNIGPNVRLSVAEHNGQVVLKRDPPPSRDPAWTGASRSFKYPDLVPDALIVAVPESLRTSPSRLNRAAADYGKALQLILRRVDPRLTVTVGARFISLRDYLGKELPRLIGSPSPSLARVRMSLAECSPALSLHLALVRLTLGRVPLMDIVFDTSDSDLNLDPRCTITFAPGLSALSVLGWGTHIDASSVTASPAANDQTVESASSA